MLDMGAWAGSSVSHGLREGVQRSRGRAKVTHRAGGGAGSPACVRLSGGWPRPRRQVSWAAFPVCRTEDLGVFANFPELSGLLGPTWGPGRDPDCGG